MDSKQRILVAVDGTPTSRRTVDYVADMVGGGSGFHAGLFHFQVPPHMLEWGGSEDVGVEHRVSGERADEYRHMEKKAIEESQSFLAQLHADLASKGVDVIADVVRFEEPLSAKHIARDLLEIAKKRGYGTIVVGRHSLAGWKQLFGHRVGEELLRTGHGVTIWIVE